MTTSVKAPIAAEKLSAPVESPIAAAKLSAPVEAPIVAEKPIAKTATVMTTVAVEKP